MADLFSPPGPEEPTIGAALRAARKRAGLTGGQLAARAGISQAKVSRLETGASGADPADVRLLADAMRLPPAERDELVRLAQRTREQMRDWRPEPGGLPRRQDEISVLEQESKEIRVFNPAVVPGLMQTSQYAEALMVSISRMHTPEGAGPALRTDVMAAVTRRIRRQQLLASPAKAFYFVITESVLGNGIGSPEDMIGQIRRLRDLARLPNVTFAIIPARSFLPDAPMHSFELLDEQAVIIDLFNTSVTSQGRADVKLYRELFGRLETAAVAAVDATLSEYAAHYRRLLGA
ncbi:helix-turn-helix domain-containing protein [Actinoplanes aureus]|uniref:Helix-turn-helix domain-containing protein n=1 Tax=Actinoplanes aureus TaxID=2792083 RepID=A0A931CIH4_9ACTN|nr:helix-turn-helix transcriptional regulator [Actinoplanes aureus]MBG0568267.1 helix-turn-helix domain-containing protein [Actinoplanes aureus]